MTWPVIAGSAPPVGMGTGRNASLPKEAKRGDAARGRSVRVLIVDDEPSICKALGMALGHAGYEILTARSGEAAFAVIDTQRVDILLMDLRIPDMRGDAIFEYAAGVQTHLRDHTLFITGDISDQAVELIGALSLQLRPQAVRPERDARRRRRALTVGTGAKVVGVRGWTARASSFVRFSAFLPTPVAAPCASTRRAVLRRYRSRA